MARQSWKWITALAVFASVTGWMYLDNRDVRQRLQRADRQLADHEGSRQRRERPVALAARASQEGGQAPSGAVLSTPSSALSSPPPTLPDAPKESRMERRSRRSAEMAALFGRLDGESEAEYRDRVLPMITGILEVPRQRAVEMRREAEAKAGVTAEQSAKIDQAIAATYNELIDYTNAAVSEGQLSPYQRSVSGWLGYAGGLGGILSGSEGAFGSILRPEQVRTMYDSGFEWGEFLAVSAPWERLKPPPPPR